MKVILFKDSSCELCKLMQQELIDNPPIADLTIIHASRENCSQDVIDYNVDKYPITLLLDDDNNVISKFEGFVDSKSIDINIKDYETKSMV